MAHIVSIKTYSYVWLALMVLLAATIGLHFFPAGPFNLVAALGIAAMKAALVVLFFMHVKYSSHLIWIVSLAGFYWLAILILLVMSDYSTRSLLPGFAR